MNDLLSCPFCGCRMPSDGGHEEGCYFTLLARLKAAPEGDLSLMPSVLDAWNRRSPAGAPAGVSDEREAFEAAWLEIMGGAAAWLARADESAQGDSATYAEVWTRRARLLWQRALLSAGAPVQEPGQTRDSVHEAAPDAERALRAAPLPSLSESDRSALPRETEPHSVHLAADDAGQDFRMRPAFSDAAPGAEHIWCSCGDAIMPNTGAKCWICASLIDKPATWPHTPQDIKDMIGSSFTSARFVNDPQAESLSFHSIPADAMDLYTVTAHDLLEAFGHWREYVAERAAADKQESLPLPAAPGAKGQE